MRALKVGLDHTVGQDDRRRAPRIPCYVGASLRTVESRDAILSYAVELSETGALIRTLRTIPAGTRVEIALSPSQHTTDTRAITVHGEVVRSTTPERRGDAHDLGVRFDTTEPLGALLRELNAPR